MTERRRLSPIYLTPTPRLVAHAAATYHNYNTFQPKPHPESRTSTMGKAVKQTRAGATTAPRQSLAATHPSNYVKAASTKMPPPPTPMLTGQTSASALAKAKSPSTTTSPLNYPYPTPSPSPPEKLHHDFNTPAAGNHTFKDPRTCPPSGGRPPGNQDQCTQISGVGQHGVARPWERHNDPTVRKRISTHKVPI